MAQWHSHAHNRRFGLNENKYYGEQLSNWKEPRRFWDTVSGDGMRWEESKRNAEGGRVWVSEGVEGEQEKRWLIDDFVFEILKMVSAFFEYYYYFLFALIYRKRGLIYFCLRDWSKYFFFMFRSEAAENYRCDYRKRRFRKILNLFFGRCVLQKQVKMTTKKPTK